MQYGLRYFTQGQQTTLLQISGSGRVLLQTGETAMWSKPPDAQWEVYRASQGQTYPTHEEANIVAQNLSPQKHNLARAISSAV